MSTSEPCPPEESLSRFLDGELDVSELGMLEQHLDGCNDCRRLLAVLQQQEEQDERPSTARSGWLTGMGPGTLPPGFLFDGRYRLERLLGRGAVGEVYQATDTMLCTRVALKLLVGTRLRDSEAEKLLRREVLITREIAHGNVCRIFDAGRADGICYLTMELLEGGTLRNFLQGAGLLDHEDARPFVYQMTAGLQAAHDAGVVHRDFKSENILLVPGDPGPPRVVVTDFGLAKVFAGKGLISTLGVRRTGTLTHAAPEQLRGESVGTAADIYALGVVLFELISGGHLPVIGSNELEIIRHRAQGKSPSLRRFRADVPPRWEQVISRCMYLDPAHRPRRPAEIFRALYPH